MLVDWLALPDPGFDPADTITALLSPWSGPAARARTEEPMDRSDAWTAIDDQRRALVRLLEDLPEQDWRRPSLCARWTVRQVAAHLALQNTTWPEMPRTALGVAVFSTHSLGRCQTGRHVAPQPRRTGQTFSCQSKLDSEEK